MTNKQKELIIFQNSLDKKIIIYLYKYGFVGIIIICMIILFDKSVAHNIYIWSIVLIILLFWLKFGTYLKKSAYKIRINSDKNEVQFFMMTNEQTVTKTINEIEEVRINLYITFYFDNKKVVYNDARNLELVENLHNYFNIEYGIWGKLLPKLGFKD